MGERKDGGYRPPRGEKTAVGKKEGGPTTESIRVDVARLTERIDGVVAEIKQIEQDFNDALDAGDEAKAKKLLVEWDKKVEGSGAVDGKGGLRELISRVEVNFSTNVRGIDRHAVVDKMDEETRATVHRILTETTLFLAHTDRMLEFQGYRKMKLFDVLKEPTIKKNPGLLVPSIAYPREMVTRRHTKNREDEEIFFRELSKEEQQRF